MRDGYKNRKQMDLEDSSMLMVMYTTAAGSMIKLMGKVSTAI